MDEKKDGILQADDLQKGLAKVKSVSFFVFTMQTRNQLARE